MQRIYRLFSNIPEAQKHESVWELLKDRSIRIERIVSQGQISPPGFWYEQEEHEWVMVLSGQATIKIEEQQAPVTLGPGDAIHLPAHVRHRVEWTDLSQPTIWLAVFWKS
ncbi:MAG: cupin domain-containing protein [Nitrospirales bacterium]|nr:cupin domain-containing protein [Nitrospirales bacterium]